MPGDSGVTVMTCVRATLNFCTQDCGRIGRPAFPAPSIVRGREIQDQTSRKPAARSRKCGCKRCGRSEIAIFLLLIPGCSPSNPWKTPRVKTDARAPKKQNFA